MIRLAFHIRDSQEIDRRHVPRISEAIRGSGGIESSYVSTKAKKVSTLRGPAQLADLPGTLCVSAQYPTNTLTNGVVDRPWVFGAVGSNPTLKKINFFRLYCFMVGRIFDLNRNGIFCAILLEGNNNMYQQCSLQR